MGIMVSVPRTVAQPPRESSRDAPRDTCALSPLMSGGKRGGRGTGIWGYGRIVARLILRAWRVSWVFCGGLTREPLVAE